jgi:ferritin-like metal-binding protein YciE
MVLSRKGFIIMASDTSVHETIVDWVGDVVAVESHIEEALDHQLKLSTGSSEVGDAIQHFHDTVRDSKKCAVAFQESQGTTAGNPVIKTGAELLGKAAGVIDRIRKDTPSKALRDDYVAFNMAAISYTMLHTTALALEDQKTVAFAAEGLSTYAKLITKVNSVIPRAVIDDLLANGDVEVKDPNMADNARKTIDQIWKDAAH